MGAGTMLVRSYHRKRGYYLARDSDEKLGGRFTFLLLPLFGLDGQRFFYVIRQGNSCFEVEGECYICTNSDSLKRHLETNRQELAQQSLWYYHLDKNGNIEKKEREKCHLI